MKKQQQTKEIATGKLINHITCHLDVNQVFIQ